MAGTNRRTSARAPRQGRPTFGPYRALRLDIRHSKRPGGRARGPLVPFAFSLKRVQRKFSTRSRGPPSASHSYPPLRSSTGDHREQPRGVWDLPRLCAFLRL